MKLSICSLVTRTSGSIFSYFISVWSITELFFFIVILLASQTQSVLRWQSTEMDRFCSCGLQVSQQKFCEHDFVFAGKRVNRKIRTFNYRNGTKIPQLSPYRGLIYRIRMTYNFKGVFVKFQKTKIVNNIYVLRGINCGFPENAKPLKRHRNYVISGYKYKNMLIVTSCNWLQPFGSISSMQAIGLFDNFYQNYCNLKDKCKITFHYKNTKSFHQGCKYVLPYKECYEKHALCQFQSNNQCGLLTNVTSLSNTALLGRLPNSLKKKIHRDKSITLNHFQFCLRRKFIERSWRPIKTNV